MSIKIEGYEILEQAGGTTDTTIWTARQISLDRNVSIWVLKNHAAADPTLVEHFSTITRAIARLKHNNFPPVIDISTTPEGVPYIVFENADSTSITRLINENGVYAVNEAFNIAKEVALALDAAWKQTGLVHRNLKPDNLRIFADGNVKIFNFNSATIVQPGKNPLAFDDGMLVGTPNYASPEQIDCLPSIDFHADMYGLGASLYQMFTGKAPFDEERDPIKILELQRTGRLADPRRINPALSDDVVYILARLMAKNPADRYVWWLDVVEDIEHVLEGRPLRNKQVNSVLNSTIEYSLNQNIIGVGDSSKTCIIPIIPENNIPITDITSETIRNPQTIESNLPNTKENVASPIAPIAPIAKKVAVGSNTSKPSQKINAQPNPGNIKRKYQSMIKPKVNGLVKLFTLVFCLSFIVAFVFLMVDFLGPAGAKNNSTQKDNDAGDKSESQGSKHSIDSSKEVSSNVEGQFVNQEEETQGTSDEVKPSAVVEEMDLSELNSAFADATEKPGTTVVQEEIVSQPIQKQENTTDSAGSREELLSKAYNELKTKDIVTARASIKELFKKNANKPGINRAELKGILKVLDKAISESDAVGIILVNQTQNSFKRIVICGKEVEIRAISTTNDGLRCYVRGVGKKDSKLETIPLSKASPKELYVILSSSFDNSEEIVLAKAILALRLNKHADFVRYTKDKRIKALQPFEKFMK